MIEKDTIDISLGEVAQRAGLNSALIGYYFGGKEGLLMALVKRDTGVINFNFRYPYMTRLMHPLMRDPASENSRKISEFFTGPVTRAEARILNEGMKSGKFRKVDPVLFYFSAVGACDYLFWGGSALKFVFGMEKIDDAMRRRFVEHTVKLLLQGCLAEPDADAASIARIPRQRKRNR